MGCKTIARFTYDSATVEDAPANLPIPLPNETISTKCISSDGATISIRRPGAYLVLANFTFVATAAGAIESQMFRNGNAVLGMHAISTAAAAGDNVSQAYAQPITVGQNTGEVSINFKPVQDTSVRVASVTIIKVA